MELLKQHISSVRSCKESVDCFSSNFQDINSHWQEKQSAICIQVEHFKNVKNQIDSIISNQGNPLEAYNYLNTAAKVIIATTNDILASACLFNCYTIPQFQQRIDIEADIPQHPYFLQWLQDISSLHWLFSKQNLVGGIGEKIEFEAIHGQIENAFAHIRIVLYSLNQIKDNLHQVQIQTASIQYAENFEYLRNLINLEELHQLDQLIVTVGNIMQYMFGKFTLMFDEQPKSVMMKIDKKPVASNIRDRDATTRTNISIKLVNYAYAYTGFIPEDPPNNIPDIQVEIGLISESTAISIRDSNCANIASLKYESIINSPAALSISNEAPHLKVSMKETPPLNGCRTFGVNVPNLSVMKVGRKADGNRVFREKFYFLVTLMLPSETTGAPLVAWALSTPVVIRTHSDHIEGSLATMSWEHYFAQSPFEYPSNLRTYASVNEIRNILQLHFIEWVFPEEVPILDQWLLSEDHLNFLIDMLLEDISIKSNRKKEDIQSIDLKSFYFENLTDLGFSYWSWFHKTVSILKYNYFKDLWKKGLLIGFVGKVEARNMLCKNMNGIEQNGYWSGNFLIKFSQTKEAELCVVFVNADNEANIQRLTIDKSKEESWVASFKAGLGTKVMVESDTLIDAFCYVYPGTNKWEAFGIELDIDNSKKSNAAGTKSQNGPGYVVETPILTLSPAADGHTYKRSCRTMAKEFFSWATQNVRRKLSRR